MINSGTLDIVKDLRAMPVVGIIVQPDKIEYLWTIVGVEESRDRLIVYEGKIFVMEASYQLPGDRRVVDRGIVPIWAV